LNLIEPILVGPVERIREVAKHAGLDISAMQIVDAEHSHDSAAKAVELVTSGRAEALMKGSLHTDELMGAVVSRQTGIRTARRIRGWLRRVGTPSGLGRRHGLHWPRYGIILSPYRCCSSLCSAGFGGWLSGHCFCGTSRGFGLIWSPPIPIWPVAWASWAMPICRCGSSHSPSAA
jgi:acetolactate synthase regulatory subunit